MRERAFTLIELIVVMLLLAIVFAVGSGVLIRTFKESNVTGENERLFTQFDQSRELLEQDVRAARAPGREFDLIRDRLEFARQIRTGRSRLPANLDLQDVKVATATRFAFAADVYADPTNATWNGPECVWWSLVRSGQRWSVQRAVDHYRGGCAAAPSAGAMTASWIRSIDAGSTRAPSSIFRYVLACDPSACAGARGCSTRATTPGPVTGTARNWITEVRIDLGAVSVRGRSSARDRLTADIALRNRLSNDYQYALGCVGR